MNQQVEIAPVASRTATWAAQVKNSQGHYGRLVINIGTITGTPSITVSILAVDKVSGVKSVVLASALLGAAGTVVLKVGPGFTPAANLAVNDVLPPFLEIAFTHTDAQPITYSAGLDISE